MNRVIILRGPSGSGKSTYIRKVLGFSFGDAKHYCGPMAKVTSGTDPVSGFLVSTDAYFMTEDGYNFNPALLGQAHGICLRSFVDAVKTGWPTVIVDNTNTTIRELAPYVALAEAYGYEVQIHSIVAPRDARTLQELVHRNHHGVPAPTIAKQLQRLKDSEPLLEKEFPRASITHIAA